MKWSTSRGIIVNTFENLESRTMKAMNDEIYMLDGSTPPICYIRPLTIVVELRGGYGVDDNHDRVKCLTWLDSA